MGRVNFLYTNIGRGHPHYLDGIIECMPPAKVGSVQDVFATTSGLSRRAWSLARFAYHAASNSSLAPLYSRTRAGNDLNRRGLIQRVLGRPLRAKLADDPEPLVVAHPLLVATLRDKPSLIYQHGELACPLESFVRGRHRVLVPTNAAADRFIAAAGITPDRLFVSGLCVEPQLVSLAEGAVSSRLDRLEGPGPLCGGFFSSGAEPRVHVERLAVAALSAVAAGGRALVLARRGGSLAARVSARFAAAGRELASAWSPGSLPTTASAALLCLYDGRRELNEYTGGLFGEMDYFVAPSHERTSWAVGVGLPMFILDPPLGSFSPLNRGLLLAQSVAVVLGSTAEASVFGGTIGKLQATGGLAAMAAAGWGRYDIGGFRNISQFLQAL